MVLGFGKGQVVDTAHKGARRGSVGVVGDGVAVEAQQSVAGANPQQSLMVSEYGAHLAGGKRRDELCGMVVALGV